MVEHGTENAGVDSSILSLGTRLYQSLSFVAKFPSKYLSSPRFADFFPTTLPRGESGAKSCSSTSTPTPLCSNTSQEFRKSKRWTTGIMVSPERNGDSTRSKAYGIPLTAVCTFPASIRATAVKWLTLHASFSIDFQGTSFPKRNEFSIGVDILIKPRLISLVVF